MNILRCQVADEAFPGGSAEAVLNLDHVVWAMEHPSDKSRTIVKLSGESSALMILAPAKDFGLAMQEIAA